MNVQNERLDTRATLLNLTTAILWGGNSVSIKLGLAGIPPLCLAGVRFLLGGLVVYLWTRPLKLDLKLNPDERRGILGLIAIFFIQIYLLNVGTAYTLASRSTIFISAHPFFTALFAHFFIPGDKISTRKMIGMILSFLGVVFIFVESLSFNEFQYLLGDILLLASASLLGARQVFLKRLTQNMHPGKVLIWQSAPSLPLFFTLSALFETQPIQLDIRVLSAVFYQGFVVAGFCFILITSLLQRHSASRLAVFGFTTPVIGVIISNLLLGDPISPGILFSLALVGIGITIVNTSQ